MNRGKLITFLIFGAAVGVAGFGIWFNQHQSYRVIEALSPRVTQLIAYAPEVDVMLLVPAGENAGIDHETVQVQGQVYRVASKKSGADLKGLKDARRWLLHNDNYDWERPTEKSGAEWRYLIGFSTGSDQVQLAFDASSEQLVVLSDGGPHWVEPMQKGLQAFFDGQFSPQENAGLKKD